MHESLRFNIKILWKYLHIFSISGIFREALLGEFLSHFCFVSSRLGGRFLALYTFIFVFQAYLVASLEARLSLIFLGLGMVIWEGIFQGHIWGMLMDNFQKDLNQKPHFWSFLNFILVSLHKKIWSSTNLGLVLWTIYGGF